MRGFPISNSWKIGKTGLFLFVRLTPKSAKDIVVGVEKAADETERLKIRVRANPDKGKANKALVIFLSKYFRVAKTNISLVSGSASRHKTIEIKGDDDTFERIIKTIKDLDIV